MAGVGLQLHRLGQDTIGPVQHAAPRAGQPQVARAAFDQRRSKDGFQFLDLHGQGGLADIDQRRRTPEAARLGQGAKVMKCGAGVNLH